MSLFRIIVPCAMALVMGRPSIAQKVDMTVNPSSATILVNVGEVGNRLKVDPGLRNKMILAVRQGFITEGMKGEDVLKTGETTYTVNMRQVKPLPEGFTSKKITFSKLVDMSGKLYNVAMGFGYSSASRINIDSPAFIQGIVSFLSDWGFRTISSDPLFKEKNDLPNYALAGTVLDFASDSKGTPGFRIGTIIEWSLFDVAKEKVVLKVITGGFSDTKRAHGLGDEFDLALKDALIGLVNHKEFLEKMGGATTEVDEVGRTKMEATVLPAVKRTDAQNLSEALKGALKSAVTVVADGGVGHGSGFLISAEGMIITNYHVIDGADKIEVIFDNGLKLPATLVKSHEERDIALLQIPGSGYSALPIDFTDDGASVGTEVAAIGTPKDIALGQTVTRGIISGRREMEGQQYLQTDASINPGNSGGPLISHSGKVLGVLVLKRKEAEGISFAIPIGSGLEALNISFE
ncbi:MAG: trypsin-like peptidase domain-containing protein [Flavobacteriales bacterium]|nr:trypsin-like peptidase domain-containing protein [Flavobacteriales bacterium]